MKKQDKRCGLKTEVYTRVVGFYRPTSHWNNGKLEEYNNRKTYKVEKDKNTQ